MSMNCRVFALTRQQAERLQELEDEEEIFLQVRQAPHLDVGHTWHGLHYLLTVTSSGFSGPERFLLDGGQEIRLDDGYGPARLFSPREVDDIHSVLVDIGEDELWSRFDADEMNAQEVYPFNWDDQPELTRKVYQAIFAELKEFVDQASRRGQCLVVTLN